MGQLVGGGLRGGPATAAHPACHVRRQRVGRRAGAGHGRRGGDRQRLWDRRHGGGRWCRRQRRWVRRGMGDGGGITGRVVYRRGGRTDGLVVGVGPTTAQTGW